jgi:SET domain-containing protein
VKIPIALKRGRLSVPLVILPLHGTVVTCTTGVFQDYVREYKYSKAYPMKETKEMEEGDTAYGEGCYVLEVVTEEGRRFLDATVNLDSWGRYINHARGNDANLKPFKPLMVRRKWRVAFLARRDIAKGEELTFDYGQERGAPRWMKKRGKVIRKRKGADFNHVQ